MQIIKEWTQKLTLLKKNVIKKEGLFKYTSIKVLILHQTEEEFSATQIFFKKESMKKPNIFKTQTINSLMNHTLQL